MLLGQRNLLNEEQWQGIANSISERLSQELVIALVGPVASGVSTAAEIISEVLTHDFGYQVSPIIKPSEIIRAEMHRVDGGAVPAKDHEHYGQYIDEMQNAGNRLREKYGPNYLAEKTVEKIVHFRTKAGGYETRDGKLIPLPGRRAYIIDSIKNIEELELLKQIYSETLCLMGVFAPDSIRKQRLIDLGIKQAEVQKILDRDQGEVATFGQMTRKVFIESDFFICNDQKPEELRRKVVRYVQLVFDTGIHTPTKAEAAMYEANAVAANSACMSRQVGAAIISKEQELIAIGWNDVPKFGGSLYSEDDQSVWDEKKKSMQDRDNRCFKYGQHICHNEVRRNAILDGIAKKIVESPFVKKSVDLLAVREFLKGTEVDALTEFSRSIHAEMEAILSVAREGRHSLVGATLYTTTYPCHNCARHIVAAGISKVIYIQPYLKSLATALHDDSITEDRDDQTRVVFSQYDGVAPRNFLKLFKPLADRKKQGRLSRPDPKGASPLFRVPLDAPVDYESKVIADLTQKEQNRIN